MKKKIVITGGLGYIGTELCKIYSGESWNSEVTVIDKNFFSDRVNQLTNWDYRQLQYIIHSTTSSQFSVYFFLS